MCVLTRPPRPRRPDPLSDIVVGSLLPYLYDALMNTTRLDFCSVSLMCQHTTRSPADIACCLLMRGLYISSQAQEMCVVLMPQGMSQVVKIILDIRTHTKAPARWKCAHSYMHFEGTQANLGPTSRAPELRGK